VGGLGAVCTYEYWGGLHSYAVVEKRGGLTEMEMRTLKHWGSGLWRAWSCGEGIPGAAEWTQGAEKKFRLREIHTF